MPAVGSCFRNPDLAKTYQRLADLGVNDFYRGATTKAIVQAMQSPPVVDRPPFKVWLRRMTTADLDRYEVGVRPPIEMTYQGYRLFGMGLPSSGGITVAQPLGLLEG